ncbi:MAG TPA: outer membrane beta-barrel protein [Chthoniobacterales bacterium]|nr:outer membrane beta-barrel protein [Chthoniobacterales bacterium]
MKKSLTKYFLGLVFVFAAVTLCNAGPMPVEKNVAPAPPPCDWTGFYVGVNGGVGWQQSRFTDNDYAGYEGYYEIQQGGTATWDNVNGVIGGQIGFNYQWKDLVLGIEADADYSGNSINKARLYGTYETSRPENWGWYDKARVDFQGSVRARVGISLLDNKALIYMTGGAAFVHGEWKEYAAYYTSDEDGYYDMWWNGNDWRWGLIGGVGMEYRLNCHWSIKAEGLYTWLAEDQQDPKYLADSYWSTYGGAQKYTFGDELYSFRVGVNYNFGSFGLFGH